MSFASRSKMKKVTPVQRDYQLLAQSIEPTRPIARNCMRAFIAGGAICFVGEALMKVFQRYFGFTEQTAGNPTVAVLILLSVILTAFGVYDKIAQWAGAGSAVPVTGFANSLCSAAIEHKSEGLVLGTGGNMFKLAGSVIVFGTVSAFAVGIVHWIIGIKG
ncbi:stage V sporulation protein AC [Paenibacillus methanolicus]|uniref:Stage V sporulation protein AC n=2 Tax=Paenibacillus methanolicus TaxID=582686 RepID=A0A5S5CLR2_9BACL|nr:stage V sporulation protein AC [Paenibacillus methanolicus]TYP79451.1 stage V sporulation protein AC [Paenibacillus methanolicus]